MTWEDVSSSVWEWWHRWIPFDVHEYVDPLPPLGSNEHIARESYAIPVQRAPSTKGRLVLTTDRLMYQPMVSRSLRLFTGQEGIRMVLPLITIDLAEIARVEERGWFHHLWGGYPGFPRVVITLEGGRTHIFQVDRHREWREHIDTLRRARRIRNLKVVGG